MLGGCSPRSGEAQAPTPASTTAPAAPTPTRPTAPRSSPAATESTRAPIVILVSVDGLNPDAITQLDAAGRVPTLRRLIAEGAATLNARTAYEQTNTLPNHAGILTGRPVDGPDGTHVTFNSEHPGSLATVNGHYVRGVFDPVHDAGLSTMFLAGKTKFDFLVRSWPGKLDFSDISRNPDKLTGDLLSRLHSTPPRLTFLHLAGPDEAGHNDLSAGFMGPRYLDAVATADARLGTILDEVLTNPRLLGRTTVIVTADHGGRGLNKLPGLGHRAPGILDNYRIPFIVWGPQVPAGADLYVLNSSRRTDPGTARIGYTGRQPIRNLDAADLVLSIFGLPALPGTPPGGVGTLRRN